MKLKLLRSRGHNPKTFGRVVDGRGRRLVFTVEPEVIDRDAHYAIPAGEYALEIQALPIYGKSLVIRNVPGFGDVRMTHYSPRGNAGSSPVLGLEIGLSGVERGTSKAAVALVMETVEAAIASGKPVTLCIVDPPQIGDFK